MTREQPQTHANQDAPPPGGLYEELARILAHVTLHSARSFSIGAGPKIEVEAQTTGWTASPGPHPMPAHPLVRELQRCLYDNGYARRFDPGRRMPSLPPPSDPSFVAHLSHANLGRDRWEPGWQVYQVAQSGQVFVQKGERQRSALPGEYVSFGAPGAGLQPGAFVALRGVHESNAVQPLFYFAFGDTLSDVWDEHSLLRFYFHASAAGVPELLRYLTQALNSFQVPFRLKTLSEPGYYDRADACVLYLARRHYHVTARLVQSLPAAAAAVLSPWEPLFTKRIRPGVGLAEEPNTGESFGMHRARLVAEALLEASTQGAHTTAQRLAAIEARFAAYGLDLRCAHLNAGSADLEHVGPRQEAA